MKACPMPDAIEPTIKTRRAMFRQRHCYVCRQPIPETAGVWHAGYGILTHRGDCADRADACKRNYDQSMRGRWRRRTEVLRLIETQWKEPNQ